MTFSFGMDFGSFLGAGLGAIAANASSRKAYKYQSALQQQAYNLTQQGYREGPKNQRQGLEDAGYNPMLAVQNGVAGTNATFSAGQASAPDYAGGISAGVQNALNIQGMKNQTEQTNSTVKLNEALGRKATSEAVANETRNPYISRREEAFLRQIGAQTDKLIRETQFFDALQENMEVTRRLQEMGLDVQRYGIDKNLEGVIYNADTNKEIAENHSPSGRSASFENYTKGVQNVLSGVGSIIHGYNETNNYNGSDESETVYYDKNGNVRGSVSHKGSKKGSSNKSRKRR